MSSGAALEDLRSRMRIDTEELSLALQTFVREHMEKLQRDGVVLGLSGGLDSSVVAALCARAVGPKKTLALMMPERDSERSHIGDALELAKKLNIDTRMVDLARYLRRLGVYRLAPVSGIPLMNKLRAFLTRRGSRYFERKTGETPFSASLLGMKDTQFSTILKRANAYYRIKHRMRMVLLYLWAERENRLVVGAANRTEALIGYFVKHGCDHAADIMPILHLYKTQVRELARHLDMPSRIIEKPPSPDIIPGVLDEEAIGISYERLDLILLGLETGWQPPEIAGALDLEVTDVARVKSLMEKSAHMRTIYSP